MPFLYDLILLVLLPICCFGPGFFIVRRLRWSGTEKICGSIGLSLILIYLIATLVYFSGLNWRWCWLITAGLIALSAKSWPDMKPFLHRSMVRKQFAAFAGLLTLGVLLLGLIIHYSGGKWAGDWIEHYDRTRFFIERLPYDKIFIDLYLLPARPPMMHLIAAYFLGHIPLAYDRFQIVSLFLNTLAFFPCVLLAGQFTRQGPRRIWLIGALLATSPMFLQNITFTWNKQMASCFIIMSIAFYLRGWHLRSPSRMIAAAVSMAVAILVHYSAGPYAVFLVAHYLWTFFRQRRKPFELLATAGSTIVLLFTWLGWSIAIYGMHDTFASNTTVAGSEKMEIRTRISSIVHNIFYTVVPHPLRWPMDRFGVAFDQPNAFGYWRDYFFLMYQTNILCGFGLLAWVVVLYLVWRMLRRTDRQTVLFWGLMTAFVVPVGIAANSTTELEGVAHVCLQPMILIGLTLLAANFLSMRRWLRIGVTISLVIDVILGIVLHFRMEMLAFWVHYADRWPVFPISSGMLNPQAVVNSAFRFLNSVKYTADDCLPIRGLILLMVILTLAYMLILLANAAWTGRSVLWQRPSGFAIVMVGLYGVGATLAVSDHFFRYNVFMNPSPPWYPTQEEVAAAIEPFVRKVNANPESPDAIYDLAETCYEYGQVEPAAQALQSALLLDPNHAKAHYLMGIIQVANHLTLTPREPAYTSFFRTYHDTAQKYVQYGVNIYVLGFKAKATEVLTEAVKEYPNYAMGHINLGVALYEAGKSAEGISQCETALRLDPGSHDAVDRLREMLVARGDSAAAIDQRIRDLQQGR